MGISVQLGSSHSAVCHNTPATNTCCGGSDACQPPLYFNTPHPSEPDRTRPTAPHRAGNCGISADLPLPADPLDAVYGAHATLFAEELGLVVEVAPGEAEAIAAQYNMAGVPARVIGKVRVRACMCASSKGRKPYGTCMCDAGFVCPPHPTVVYAIHTGSVRA